MLIYRVGEHLGGLDVDLQDWIVSGRFGCRYAGSGSILEVWMLIFEVGDYLLGLDVNMRGWRVSGRFEY